MNPEVDWKKIRNNYFPALKKLTYIMAASASPINRIAYDKAVSYYKDMMMYGDIHYDNYVEEVDILRCIIAEYINANPNEIAFLINTSSGMNIISKLLDKNREIIYPSIEFPASTHVFKIYGFKCIAIDDINNSYPLENYQKVLTPQTGYVINSYVQSLTGFRQILEKIGSFCQKNDLFHIVNATQGFSSFEIDVKKQKIDMLVSNGLKWPGCGYGAGILYIKNDFIDKLPTSGWLSVKNAFQLDNENLDIINQTKYMDAFGGCPNYGALIALKGSFELIQNNIGSGKIKEGVKRIQKRIIKLTTNFIEKIKTLELKIISPLEKEYRSGIITLEHERAAEIHSILEKYKIFVTLKRYPKESKDTLLRFAFNYYNNQRDIDYTIRILKNLL